MGEEVQKILFVQEIAENHFETEGLWCVKVGENQYVVDNIPFVAKRISLGDTIEAIFDEEDNAFYFEDFVAVSGNTTLRVYFGSVEDIPMVREKIEQFSCESEAFLTRNLIAVNVPREVNYLPLKEFLDNGEKKGAWTYEESCLMHEY
ncbi:MAG: DUF4265 domain-containing protein [Terrimonas ferruginea]|uniref:DUF4265 domain-containing protein n=1 Tax=Terrimonas ferruginea TaxID=249 RepID=UPI000928F680|nr:DUF4265 domain-containing protein [Terrimonas ferruginea]MBN8785430.1 DUF4265 domain-containing protein [Terrimonas ferruginea]OJW45481.1 MAG: hypothetical protein BGO56_02020 [Sphingobacteriales bacterium 48-107]